MMSAPTLDQSQLISEKLLGRRPDCMEPFHPAAGGHNSHSFRFRAGSDELLLSIKKGPDSPVGIYRSSDK